MDRTRDGETYSSRLVKATQDGKAIFTMQTSFKIDEQQDYHYQMEMPEVAGPENFKEYGDLLRARLRFVITSLIAYTSVLVRLFRSFFLALF